MKTKTKITLRKLTLSDLRTMYEDNLMTGDFKDYYIGRLADGK